MRLFALLTTPEAREHAGDELLLAELLPQERAHALHLSGLTALPLSECVARVREGEWAGSVLLALPRRPRLRVRVRRR